MSPEAPANEPNEFGKGILEHGSAEAPAEHDKPRPKRCYAAQLIHQQADMHGSMMPSTQGSDPQLQNPDPKAPQPQLPKSRAQAVIQGPLNQDQDYGPAFLVYIYV